MRSIITKIPSLFVATLFLTSCATTSLVDTWHNPSLPSQRLQKLLVVSMAKNGATRRVYEDVLAGELMQRGVIAVPGYTLITNEEKTDRQVLESAVKQAGAEAVLTLETTKVKKETTVSPGYSTYPGIWYPGAFPSWDLYGYYGATTFYEPPNYSTYEVATIQANLFDARSGKLLWAATIQSYEPGQTVSVSKDLARIIIQSLSKEGFI